MPAISVTLGTGSLVQLVVRQWLAANRWIVATIILYGLAGYAVATYNGVGGEFSINLYSRPISIIYAATLIAGTLGYIVYVMTVVRPARLTLELRTRFREEIFTPQRLITGAPIVVLLSVVLSTFTSLKADIPIMNPYDWDETFIVWDRWLHFGVDPWRLIHPIVGYPIVSWALNAVYHLWYFALHVTTFYMAFRLSDPRLRVQFFVSLVVVWALLGNVMATALASVGPCFYGLLTGSPDPFAPLLEYLRATDAIYELPALDIQEMIWIFYTEGSGGIGRGISAMPSIHVASALLFYLVWRRIDRRLGWLALAFLIATQIGSVHLGYHYAIDGYVGIAGTALIWWGVGRVLRKDPVLQTA